MNFKKNPIEKYLFFVEKNVSEKTMEIFFENRKLFSKNRIFSSKNQKKMKNLKIIFVNSPITGLVSGPELKIYHF